jgi:hypothetical protein
MPHSSVQEKNENVYDVLNVQSNAASAGAIYCIGS